MKTKHVLLIIFLLIALAISPVTGATATDVGPEASIPPNLKLTPVISGLTQPIFATHAGDGSGRLFIAQLDGQILILDGQTLNSTPFLDISGIVKTNGGEQGLLGLAFDPDYDTNGYFYVVYSGEPTGSNILARYEVSNGDPDVADSSSGQILLTVAKPAGEENHNGGMLAFGPDGYLYYGLGDGGGGGDNHGTIGNGQDLTALLGKILRLDVSTVPYTVPPTNPFVGVAGEDEIWAYGVRNPWRFSFDKSTGDLYIGDVGQNTQEEIDFQAAGFAGGANYGWRIREGNLCFNPSNNCGTPTSYVAPVAVYNHSSGCSVTGGYVYRGTAFPGLVGVYLYGDFCTGNLWGLYKNNSNQWVSKLIKDTSYNISSFAEGEDGELYLLSIGGDLVHITQSPIITTTFTSGAALDGHITETTETSIQGGVIDAANNALIVGDTAGDRQMRAILSFNTSSLPDGAVITYAKLRIKKSSQTGGDPFATLGQLVADIGNPAFSGNPILENSDFQAAAGANSVAIFSSPPIANWYSAPLTQASLSRLNLIGNSQFRLRFTIDDNDNLANDRINFISGNMSTNKPELILNYFVP
jgi:glucose/arabinose dehydrogenase